jgi:flagellar biosynthesis regulator FlbT
LQQGVLVMTNKHPKNFLIDGPLMDVAERRAAMTLQMAAVLLADDGVLDPSDTHRVLHGAGYNAIDVMMLAEAARYEAHQQLVARVISDE